MSTNPFSAKKGSVKKASPAAKPSETADVSVGKGAVEPEQASLPPLAMEEVSCRTCRFFEFRGQSRDTVHQGECRRFAPSPGEIQQAQWPKVAWQDWCGDWTLGVSQEDMVRMARAVADTIGEPTDKPKNDE